ncbi:MAG TPA: sodium/glutamate symporter [Verrucomicrobiae bacterium]|nr:sodium/glutamate symporter [Verrucomicrobiae bacterium]
MHPLFQSIVVLVIILAVARFIKRGSGVLQKFFIPSALVAGVLGLVFGPQVLGTIPEEITAYWATWPKYLITVVFAGLFLGKVIPGRKEIWKVSGPMIAFGNSLAWGQYVLGILVTMLFLTPVFGTSPLAGALIEISFEGGHGTAAGLAPTFEQLGWKEGTDIALGLATVSIVAAIIIGIFFVNWHSRRGGGNYIDPEVQRKQRQQMIRSGYNLITFGRKLRATPRAIAINVAAFAIAIGIGWVLLQLLIIIEAALLGGITDIRFFTHLPLFPLAMIGGLIVQMILRKFGKQTLIQRRTAEIISTLALDILIASAIATVSLSAIGSNLPVFITFALLGIGWIVFGFLVLAPRMFSSFWFEKGLTNMGQSMGMTATGLLLGRLADPSNKSHSRETFGYKQLAFEPFMGGGIVTAGSVIALHEFGQIPVLIGVSLITVFWIWLGIRLGKKRPVLPATAHRHDS